MSREEAIKILKEPDRVGVNIIKANDEESCEYNAKSYVALDMAIKALLQEPCEDAISRQEVIETLKELDWRYNGHPGGEVYGAIYKLPPVQPKIKTGQWVLLDECSNSGYYCSECHKKLVKEGWSDTVKKIKYCPNCGAKLVELQAE